MAQVGSVPRVTTPSVRMGPGFGDFLGWGSRGFFLVNTVGAVFPSPAEFFNKKSKQITETE
jgi:hypothetical protein